MCCWFFLLFGRLPREMATKSGQGDMNELKAKVLIGRIGYLSSELGDPARYFPALRAKGVLFTEDCEKIKAKVTASEKVREREVGLGDSVAAGTGVRDGGADPQTTLRERRTRNGRSYGGAPEAESASSHRQRTAASAGKS